MEKGTREKAIPNEDESTVKFTSVRTAPLFYTLSGRRLCRREGKEGDRESDGVVNKRYDFRRQIWERAGGRHRRRHCRRLVVLVAVVAAPIRLRPSVPCFMVHHSQCSMLLR